MVKYYCAMKHQRNLVIHDLNEHGRFYANDKGQVQ